MLIPLLFIIVGLLLPNVILTGFFDVLPLYKSAGKLGIIHLLLRKGYLMTRLLK